MWLSLAICLIMLGLLFNTIRNIVIFRRTIPVSEHPRVSVLIPARNEAHTISHLIMSLRRQDYESFHVVVLDDDSSDDTYQVAQRAISDDARFTLLRNNAPLPKEWIGKAWACHQLSHHAEGEILCFIDADVTLSPDALSKSVDILNELQLDLICPYPRQVATTLLARIVQPLLQWSWMATLPLDVSHSSPRTSLAAGNGQLLLISHSMYQKIGGHTSVKSEILEDIELVKAVKRAGGKGGVWDGSDIAQCTMYRTNTELLQGYAKSLWRAFGSIPGGLFVSSVLVILFLQPFIALVNSSTVSQVLSVISILTALLSRILVHRQFKYPLLDSLLYPLSFIAFATLMMTSCWKRIRGTLQWKARPLYD